MSKIQGWEGSKVKQLSINSCVAAGFEFLLNMAGVDIIEGFQQMIYDAEGTSFVPAINILKGIKKYKNLFFEAPSFYKRAGEEKIAFINDKISNNIPVLMAVANELERVVAHPVTQIGTSRRPIELWFAGCHIMPVVEIDEENIIFWEPINEETRIIATSRIIWKHNLIPGAQDVAWLNRESVVAD